MCMLAIKAFGIYPLCTPLSMQKRGSVSAIMTMRKYECQLSDNHFCNRHNQHNLNVQLRSVCLCLCSEEWLQW
ncbi:hypothetical protein DPMN_191061 [Dreissena polymorpha]|uniref:Uncharacterized protein n=1 Tax=Dreissena polymorpha TaxID=45954 RepID=A0A9D3XZR3_DREPO|nr:hypothetical protein DPMN_191061 [Dreissena polymorpha]